VSLFSRTAFEAALEISVPAGPLTVLQFETPDVEQACAAAQEGGAKLLRGPFGTPWGTVSGYLVTGDGQLLEFYHWA
jgi:hypothetical protein